MPLEPISPELALVDPELAARARAALPDPVAARPSPPVASVPAPAPALAPAPSPAEQARARYPLWARLTAMLWILVIGILIGGAAIPHAKDNPTIVPRSEEAGFCELPEAEPTLPARPLGPIGGPGRP